MVFVFASFDNSDNIFKKQIQIAQDITNKQTVQSNATLIACVLNGSPPKAIFGIASELDKVSTIEYLKSLQKPTTMESLSNTIQVAKRLLTSSNAIRPSQSKTMVIFVGKQDLKQWSNQDKDDLQKLKDDNIHIVFVVIGQLFAKDGLIKYVENEDQIINPTDIDDFDIGKISGGLLPG